MTAAAVRTGDDVRRFVEDHCLPDTSIGRVGVETEWFVVDAGDPQRSVPPERTRAALGTDRLPGGSFVTFEPGGQLELSSPPCPLPRSLRMVAADLSAAQDALDADGLRLVGLGADPVRPPLRQLDLPRYASMAAYFAAGASAGVGPVMMCSTASVQVNLDLGEGARQAARWRLAHALGPVLVATFAASPALHGRTTGWESTRQAVWAELDPSRTRPAVGYAYEPAEAWTRYLLTARLMLVRDRGVCHPVLDGSSFSDWMTGRGPLARPPTLDDLAYHATTTFPPVRPRGWLELRYLDAQPDDGWLVAVAVTTALLDDPVAADAAAEACAPVAGRWMAAARDGLADADLHRAARRCLAAAREALPRLGVDDDVLSAVDDFAERSVEAGRCPADSLLDRLARTGPAGLLDEEPLCTPTRLSTRTR